MVEVGLHLKVLRDFYQFDHPKASSINR